VRQDAAAAAGSSKASSLVFIVVAALFGGFVGNRAMHTESFGGPAILVMANGGAAATMLLGLVFTVFDTTRKLGLAMLSVGFGVMLGFWGVVSFGSPTFR
jgi:hypothetical protein